MKRKSIILISIACVLPLICGELFARHYLGLGTPPLSVEHPKIEYMSLPDQDVYRFGNHIVINHYGMRSKPFAPNSTGELRVLVFGDSVLNGWTQTDQAELATTLLQERLIKESANNVVVGNISACSWGPGNWLAYANQFGFFDADIVILVISSHDYADNPTFHPIDENRLPTKRPVSALAEGIKIYLPRYISKFTTGKNASEPNHFVGPSPEEEIMGIKDLKDFLVLSKNSSKFVLVLQHWEKEEIKKGEAKHGNLRIREVCETVGISPVQLMPYFLQSIKSGNNPYIDNIHPNRIGQQLIAEAIYENLPDPVLQRAH